DLFESVLTVAADAEAEPDDFLLLRGKRLQDVRRFVADVRIDDGVDGRAHPAVFDQVAKGRFAIPAHGSFERNGVSRNGLQLLDLLNRDVHAAADLFVRGYAAKFLFEF